MSSNVIDFAKQFIGRQETAGPNRGPLVDRWKGAVASALSQMAIPWCGCFVFAMLAEFNSIDRKELTRRMGYRSKTWWPESTDSWLAEARANATITTESTVGDLFVLMKPVKGGYSKDDAYHIGFVAGKVTPGKPFNTIEGNTVPGTVEGALSREGNSVALRSRVAKPDAVVFMTVPMSLKGTFGPPTTGTPPTA